MSGRSQIAGLAALSILIVSAIAAQPASAEQLGYECSSSTPAKAFSDAHCLSPSGEKEGSFGHVLLPKFGAALSGTNGKTASSTTAATTAKLKTLLFNAIDTEISCENLQLTGEGSNTPSAFDLDFTVLTFGGCVVSQPAGLGCVVVGGAFETKKLLLTTAGQEKNRVKFSPREGTEIAQFKIECKLEGTLNTTFLLSGSFVANASGATLTTAHAGVTAQNTLKFGKLNVGLESALTLSAKETGAGIVLT